MERITLPASSAEAISEVGALAALLDKNGWRAAAFIAVSVEPGADRLSAVDFSKALKAKGWSVNVIRRHYAAWERAADEGLVKHAVDLAYGERVEVPTVSWVEWYPPRWSGDEEAEAVAAQAKLDGAGASKAVDISQNLPAMAAAIKASPKVAAAAAAAISEVRDEQLRSVEADIDVPDARDTPDVQLAMALDHLIAAVGRVELTARPFTGKTMLPSVYERLEKSINRLDMIRLSLQPTPDFVREDA